MLRQMLRENKPLNSFIVFGKFVIIILKTLFRLMSKLNGDFVDCFGLNRE